MMVFDLEGSRGVRSCLIQDHFAAASDCILCSASGDYPTDIQYCTKMTDRLATGDHPLVTPLVQEPSAASTSSTTDTAAMASQQQQQHAYRLPELADAMRQTVSYGGCAVSPMATHYQRIDVDRDADGEGINLNPKVFHRENSESKPIGVDDRLSMASMSSTSRLFQGNDAFNGKTGRPHTLILRFDTSGNGTFQQMSRLDVLRLTQEAAKPKKLETTDSSRDDDDGNDDDDEARDDLRPASRLRGLRRSARRGSDPRIGEFSVGHKPVSVQHVHARDIRKLDHAFGVSNEPSIVVRKQAIIMNADPLRAVIMRDTCLVFVPDGADSLLSTLTTKFREYTAQQSPTTAASESAASGSSTSTTAASFSSGSSTNTTTATSQGESPPFEMRALEALLATLCRSFQHDYEKTAPVVTSALDRLAHGKNISMGELEKLRGFKNTMNEFESQVDGVRRALMEMLDDEEGLRLLHLTKLHDQPSLLYDLYSFDSEDVEVLVENYLQDIFSTRTKATLLQHRIQNTESLVMLKLDSMRNYLLGVELIFSLVAISISMGTYVTGAFGMNLNSHLQTEAGWFWGIVLFTVFLFILFTASGVVFFRQKGVLI